MLLCLNGGSINYGYESRKLFMWICNAIMLDVRVRQSQENSLGCYEPKSLLGSLIEFVIEVGCFMFHAIISYVFHFSLDFVFLHGPHFGWGISTPTRGEIPLPKKMKK